MAGTKREMIIIFLNLKPTDDIAGQSEDKSYCVGIYSYNNFGLDQQMERVSQTYVSRAKGQSNNFLSFSIQVDFNGDLNDLFMIRQFEIENRSYQAKPTKKQIITSKNMMHIFVENEKIQQMKHKTAFKNFKREINDLIYKMTAEQISKTAKIIQLFQIEKRTE
ncbi:Hypothetical_protein [Hexamita inflata]|uniref:Hypothetical_protein n=1 Tax=Hexamita inflata TaxID=28002 RepID=A0AA86NME2_9EUKA|nr:Hypothetical protein HINF_LOCUS9864 [Hexamita inflata]